MVRSGRRSGQVKGMQDGSGWSGQVKDMQDRSGRRSGQVKGMQDGSEWSGQVKGMQDESGWSGQVKKTVGSGQGHAGRVWVVRTGQEDGRVRSRACRTGLGGQDRSGRRSGHGGRKQNWSGGRLGQVGKTIWTGYEGGHQVRR